MRLLLTAWSMAGWLSYLVMLVGDGDGRSVSRPNRDCDLVRQFIWCSVNFFLRISLVGAPWPGLLQVTVNDVALNTKTPAHLPNILARDNSFSSSRSLNSSCSSSCFFFCQSSLGVGGCWCWSIEEKHFLLSLPHYLFLPLPPPLLRFCPLHHVDIGQGNSV